jgi:hypothetical protein
MEKELYKGPYLISQDLDGMRYTWVWHPLLYAPLIDYFKAGIMVSDKDGNILKESDVDFEFHESNKKL